LLHENNPLEKFCEREDRMNFVRKVYAIMGVQLLFTAGIVAIPLTNTNAYFWMR
jgi:FtsH-binding integral membrane protein